jgi:chromosome partitioning protein
LDPIGRDRRDPGWSEPVTKVYALVNQKGGVGKTTTTINLGAYLAEAGLRVLLVDIDPQSNATACLGVRQADITSGSYEALIESKSAAESILRNTQFKLSLLPSTPSLAGAQVELVDQPGRERLLRRALAPVIDRYDYVLIDCPPSLGILTVNGLLAAQDGVIIPVQCEYLALEGLSQLIRTLQRVRQGLFPELDMRGMLMTMFDTRTNLSQDVVDEVRTHFAGQVFETIIPRSVRLAEAPSHGMPISAYDPRSAGAVAYQALAAEILRSDGLEQHLPEAEGAA